MKRLVSIFALASAAAIAGDPVRTVWILSNPPAPAVSIDVEARFVAVHTSGVSLRYLGPLQSPPGPERGARQWTFRIPRFPEPQSGRLTRIPTDAAGVFVNGVPIYNQFEASSYQGANLWHYDPLAARDPSHPVVPGLLEELVADGTRHSPLIGFALDGYPVYGPWGNASGGLRRMRSSYRIRATGTRESWPDGTVLTPEQYGPAVDAGAPAGTFAEDYEFVAGSGDLDESNGRWAVTPEYPEGTYAYFLSSAESGALAYPYLIGPKFHGKAGTGDERRFFTLRKSGKFLLASDTAAFRAGVPARFRLEARDTAGDRVRFFESVHERPVHLIAISEDLGEFAHIHPQLAPGDTFEVSHTFARAGRYRLWADFSLPGEAPRLEHCDLEVAGPSVTGTAASASVDIQLTPEKPMIAGADIPISIQLPGPGGRSGLEPYLGAWAHVILASTDLQTFAHLHPIDTAGQLSAVHMHEPLGPPPPAIQITANFPAAGRYKLWVQVQEHGEVITAPFIVQVDAARVEAAPVKPKEIPENAIHIQVTQHGFQPAAVTVAAGRRAVLAFTRDTAPNCGSEVLFPALGIRKAIPVGGTTVIEFEPPQAGEIAFSCGMGMYRGMVVAVLEQH